MTTLPLAAQPVHDAESSPWVQVAVGILLRNFPECPQVLMAKRSEGQHYAGYWEFPGGKVEADEHPDQALTRELKEELAIQVDTAYPWGGPHHFVYPHARVRLFFYRITQWQGEVQGAEGQCIQWFDLADLPEDTILPANRPLLRFLRAPVTHLVTDIARYGQNTTLERLNAWLNQPTPFSIQVRDKTLSPEERKAWGQQILTQVKARRTDCPVLWNGDPETAAHLGFDGVHCPQTIWTDPAFKWPDTLPESFWKSAACHTPEHLKQLEHLNFDSATYSPVYPTTTHPDAPHLGWAAFQSGIECCSRPIYALGGLSSKHTSTALEHGAHGIALCSAAWAEPLLS